MPRIAEARLAAEPSSAPQKARYRRILKVARRLGTAHGLERVQMLDVAREAEVAVATLYRYFPSKIHLFASTMAEQIDVLAAHVSPPGPSDDPVERVVDLLVGASRQLLRRPLLASAMIQANNAAHAATVTDATRNDRAFRDAMATTLGVAEPTEQDATLVRLLVQCWYGSLTQCLNGRLTIDEVADDVRLAARILLARRSAVTAGLPAQGDRSRRSR